MKDHLRRLAERIRQDLPQGENWHLLLLQQMTAEQPGLRPAVISAAVYQRLDQYRGFRHVVRNVYTFHFDPAKIEKLILEAPELLAPLKAELLAFADFLEHGD